MEKIRRQKLNDPVALGIARLRSGSLSLDEKYADIEFLTSEFV